MNFTILVEGSMLFLTHVPSLYLDCMLDVYVGIEMKIIKKNGVFSLHGYDNKTIP